MVQSMELAVYHISSESTNRMHTCQKWFTDGGVLIIGYHMYSMLACEKNASFFESLVDPGPDLVVCDEGHVLKNEETALAAAIRRIRTQRRIILTGTPLQNNLMEYHCMVQLVKPNLLGTKHEFANRFANPINNGQCADSTEEDVRLMKMRAHVLHKLIEGCVQRLDSSVMRQFLKSKREYVIAVKMSQLQTEMYLYYLQNWSKRRNLFADFYEFTRLCAHPKTLELAHIRRHDNINDDDDLCDDDNMRGAVDSDSEENGSGEIVTGALEMSLWWRPFVKTGDTLLGQIDHGGKFVLLMQIIRWCEAIGDKLLVFSQSLPTLDLIEQFLKLEASQMKAGVSEGNYGQRNWNTWDLHSDYYRFDGSTRTKLRQEWCDSFNDENNQRARLFLISTRAGGLGINLYAANRVVIFDASWNPANDVQSIFRAYRFGQKKHCYVYRFIAKGTMEEKIYERQVTKESLSSRVVDKQQIQRHYSRERLDDLYTFSRESCTQHPMLTLPTDDNLLADLITHNGQWIVSYHEHDSLLENQEDEELTKEEGEAAWHEFREHSLPVKSIRSANPRRSANSSGSAKVNWNEVTLRDRLMNPGLSQMEYDRRLEMFMRNRI